MVMMFPGFFAAELENYSQLRVICKVLHKSGYSSSIPLGFSLFFVLFFCLRIGVLGALFSLVVLAFLEEHQDRGPPIVALSQPSYLKYGVYV